MTTDTDALDNKGFSEETCVRCGWRMGQPALNCNNDDTPHRFPSQQSSSPDTDALLATVREALRFADDCVERLGVTGYDGLTADAALDSLAAELERVKAERDEAVNGIIAQAAKRQDIELVEVQARLDKALSALREIESGSWGRKAQWVNYDVCEFARQRLAEIEGEA